MTTNAVNDFPIQDHFFQTLRIFEDECQRQTDEKVKNLGEKAILTYQNLGTLQSFLYRFACCQWGCLHSDHKLEYIVGRVVSHVQASLRVLFFGYYDESLALTRNIAEIANLLVLFGYDKNKMQEWKSLNEDDAWKTFAPGKVRQMITAMGKFLPIPKEHYARLCSVGTHINPITKPQPYNPIHIPTVGTVFQELGFFVSLNELAIATSVVAGGLIRVVEIDKDLIRQIQDAAATTARQAGSVTTENMHTIWDEILMKQQQNQS